jgi:hypothetical protein
LLAVQERQDKVTPVVMPPILQLDGWLVAVVARVPLEAMQIGTQVTLHLLGHWVEMGQFQQLLEQQ